MRNLVKYVGIGLLVMGLAACDNSDSKRQPLAQQRRAMPAARQSACWMAS